MEHLMAYLKQIPEGDVMDTAELEKLLAGCWDEFGGDYGGMTPHKLLGRMEQVLWRPPRYSHSSLKDTVPQQWDHHEQNCSIGQSTLKRKRLTCK